MELYITRQVKLKFGTTVEMTEKYRQSGIDYPKFYKMDAMSKVGFLAAEELWKMDTEGSPIQNPSLILFTSAGSLIIDRAYQKTIQRKEKYFSSPSLFVYTLPNIAAGEISIRHNCKAETSCYVCKEPNPEFIKEITTLTFSDTPTMRQAVVGWINADNEYEAVMMLVEISGHNMFTEQTIKKTLNT